MLVRDSNNDLLRVGVLCITGVPVCAAKLKYLQLIYIYCFTVILYHLALSKIIDCLLMIEDHIKI